MNDRQRSAVTAYLTYALQNLELSEWRFILADDRPDDARAYAMVDPTEGRKLAVIRLCPDFFTLDADKVRHALIHECLHLHHQDVTNTVRLGLHHVLGQQAYEVLWEPFRLAVEVMVDQLAYAFADFFRYHERENRLLWAIVCPWPAPAVEDPHGAAGYVTGHVQRLGRTSAATNGGN